MIKFDLSVFVNFIKCIIVWMDDRKNLTFLVSRTRKDTPIETNIPAQIDIGMRKLPEKVLSYPNGHKI